MDLPCISCLHSRYAYPKAATDNWFTYFHTISDGQKHQMYLFAAEEWEDTIRDIFNDKSTINKHISLGFEAISKHKQRETTLWDAYIERLATLSP